MAYVLAMILKERFPASQVIVLGRHEEKLALFGFADETYFSDRLPDRLTFDHAFECTGAQGSIQALGMLIQHIRPQGAIMLLGVSEQPVAIPTRMVLEKGLVLVGCSRSGRADFVKAIEVMSSPTIQQRLRQVIYVDEPVHTVADIKRVFATDLMTSFKTVFEWRA
jgi:ribitol-5-phosphate 2-dehydrogenase